MKKILALVALFCHINCSMFLPQTFEEDVYDEYGMELNDVNSLAEYMLESFSGITENGTADEDDDSGQQFLLVRTADLFCVAPCIDAPVIFRLHNKQRIFQQQNDHLPPATEDIVSPPPEC